MMGVPGVAFCSRQGRSSPIRPGARLKTRRYSSEMEKNTHLDALFNPTAVAIVGASRDERKAGGSFIKSLMSNGFEGSFYAVNPKETEIMGLKAYSSVSDIPGELDLVVITTPARAIPKVMVECAGKRVKAVIIFSAGFREAGAEGRALEKQVLDAAREGGTRIIGPNCMGVFNPEKGLNTIVAHTETSREGGHNSFIGQSGWASENFIVAGSDRGLRFSKVVSCGNQADLTVTDYLHYLGEDPQTRFIGAYMEGLAKGREFFRVAEDVSKRKPIAIWKAGKSNAGARAVASHTASLAGADGVWDAAFNQAGIIRAAQFYELVDFAAAFDSPHLPKGNRVGLIGEAGGGGSAGSDACEGAGLRVHEFSEALQRQLKDCLKGSAAPFSSVRNPVDLVSASHDGYSEFISQCVELMAPAVDALIFFTYQPLADNAFLDVLEKLRAKIKKPIVVVPGYATRQAPGMVQYIRRGLPALPTPERAARAIAALWQYAEYLEEQR